MTCSPLFREMCSGPVVGTIDRSDGSENMLCGQQLTIEVIVNGNE